jgi:hypothetical protein
MNDDKTVVRGFQDEYGFAGTISSSHGVRRLPEEGFFTGPDIGDAMPNLILIDQWGEPRDLHIDRACKKAAVVFYRSAVW